jgi:hypothetical protein
VSLDCSAHIPTDHVPQTDIASTSGMSASTSTSTALGAPPSEGMRHLFATVLLPALLRKNIALTHPSAVVDEAKLARIAAERADEMLTTCMAGAAQLRALDPSFFTRDAPMSDLFQELVSSNSLGGLKLSHIPPAELEASPRKRAYSPSFGRVISPNKRLRMEDRRGSEDTLVDGAAPGISLTEQPARVTTGDVLPPASGITRGRSYSPLRPMSASPYGHLTQDVLWPGGSDSDRHSSTPSRRMSPVVDGPMRTDSTMASSSTPMDHSGYPPLQAYDMAPPPPPWLAEGKPQISPTPPALLSRLTNPIPGLWGTERGAPKSTTHEFTFFADEEFMEQATRWTNRKTSSSL